MLHAAGLFLRFLDGNALPLYNGIGELLAAKDFEGNPLKVEYDLMGRRTAMQSADTGRKEYHYNAAGTIASEDDSVLRGRGEEIMYRYDGMNRLVKIDYPHSVDTVYEYGIPNAANGTANRIVKITDESGTVEYKYGALGETTEEKRLINRLDTNYVADEDIFTRTMQYRSNYLGQIQRLKYDNKYDGEVVTYGYNKGGQVNRVTGQKDGGGAGTFEYVKDIGYDEFGQRVLLAYGNGVATKYEYDEERRWLKRIATASESGFWTYQDIEYDINKAGNVEGYTNDNDFFKTTQKYEYDDLYQLTAANGASAGYSNRNKSATNYNGEYRQNFAFDKIGNMTVKESGSSGTIGANLNYRFDYLRAEGSPHRMKQIGDMYYRYDANGNLLSERQGSPVEVNANNAVVSEENGIYSTDYGFALTDGAGSGGDKTYRRDYTWNERNMLVKSLDNKYAVNYRYGADGQRAVKYNSTADEQSLYYNNMETLAYTYSTGNNRDWIESKHIFVGETRIVTKRREAANPTLGQEIDQQYFYHTDHLGSAQMITNTEGTVTEHIEYTPYGELWIEQRLDAGAAKTPFRFTGKELDGETGLYYYGARYLNPKTSLWLSTDPAMGEYIPQAPVNDEVRERNGNLPGMGGVYNYVNLHLYHYAGNNPVKYTDPDGKKIFDARWWMRNADNLLSGVLSVSEVVAGLATTAATGISGVGVIIGGIMVYHGVANASTQLTKILITTIAAELRGDDYADYLDTFMPDTAIGLFFGSLAVIAGIVMNSPDNQSVEKAGAIGDLVDIGVGLLLSLSNSSFVSQSEKYLKSSGSLMNKADLLKLQQFIADAKRLPALKAVQGTVENLDRLKSYIDNMIQILD